MLSFACGQLYVPVTLYVKWAGGPFLAPMGKMLKRQKGILGSVLERAKKL